MDCLRGLEYGIKLGWYDYKSFNYKEYEFYEKVENGDMNWIIPGRFLAFSGPSATTKDPDGWRTFTPEDYAPIFKGFGVTHVVRLNKEMYDRTVRPRPSLGSASRKKDSDTPTSISSTAPTRPQRSRKRSSTRPRKRPAQWRCTARQGWVARGR